MTWEQEVQISYRNGVDDGIEQGIEQGIKRGTEQTKIETAKNLLKMKIGTVEQIAQATAITIEDVLKLQKELAV